MNELNEKKTISINTEPPVVFPSVGYITPAIAARLSPRHYSVYCQAFYKAQEVKRQFESIGCLVDEMQKSFDLAMNSDLARKYNKLRCLLVDLTASITEFNSFNIKAFQLGAEPEQPSH